MSLSDLLFSKKFLAVAVVSALVLTFAAHRVWRDDAFTGEIRELSWESRHAAEPANDDKANSKILSMVSLGAALVPEPMLIQFAQSGGQAMGLGGGQAENLQKLLTDRYRGFICLAAFPPQDAQAQFPANGIVRVLAGADEPFVENGTLNAGLEVVRQRGAEAQALLLPGADHFFLLSEEEKSAEILRAWLKDFETR